MVIFLLNILDLPKGMDIRMITISQHVSGL